MHVCAWCYSVCVCVSRHATRLLVCDTCVYVDLCVFILLCLCVLYARVLRYMYMLMYREVQNNGCIHFVRSKWITIADSIKSPCDHHCVPFHPQLPMLQLFCSVSLKGTIIVFLWGTRGPTTDKRLVARCTPTGTTCRCVACSGMLYAFGHYKCPMMMDLNDCPVVVTECKMLHVHINSKNDIHGQHYICTCICMQHLACTNWNKVCCGDIIPSWLHLISEFQIWRTCPIFKCMCFMHAFLL